MLEECIRLFQENEALNKEHNMGNFPKEAIVVHNTMGDAEGNGSENVVELVNPKVLWAM